MTRVLRHYVEYGYHWFMYRWCGLKLRIHLIPFRIYMFYRGERRWIPTENVVLGFAFLKNRMDVAMEITGLPLYAVVRMRDEWLSQSKREVKGGD